MTAFGRWRKLGKLFEPSGCHPKLKTHAANPLPVQLDGDVYRIFYSGRDEQNRSSVGAVDIDVLQAKIVREHEKPFIEHGKLGSFYEAGISVGNCYVAGGQSYMLFMGWQNPAGSHWRGDIGRMLLTPSMTLEMECERPFIGSDSIDPISLSYPWVEPLHGEGFRMWYGSTICWDGGNGEMVHVIKCAKSEDGNVWKKTGAILPYALGLAQAFSRPTVLSDSNGDHMWFSYRSGRGTPYRIGYAWCAPGGEWELRNEAAGIGVSDNGWDSEMIEYPFVFRHAGHRYMLYNGNSYGKTGFGLAIYE